MTVALRARPATAIAAAADAAQQDARALANLVGECMAAGATRHAMALRLSRLAAGRARPHHVRLARAALDPLGAADRARVFQLPNQDVVVVWRGDAAQAVQASRRAVAHLFADDEVDPGTLVELHALPSDGRALLAVVEDSLVVAPPPAVTTPAAPPLDTMRLALLEAQLAQANLARFARRQPVCGREGGRLALRWERRTLSIAELAQTLMPDRAPRADPWLFRRLTRTLDRRTLALLSAPEELRLAGPFSLALNVASILAPDFLRFDAALPGHLRGQVALELLPADVLADPAAFLFARDFARVRGYRLLLRGLDATLLRVFSRAALGVDWLALRWTPGLDRTELSIADPDGLVLTHADSTRALAWAVEHGIALVQGQAARPGEPAI